MSSAAAHGSAAASTDWDPVIDLRMTVRPRPAPTPNAAAAPSRADLLAAWLALPVDRGWAMRTLQAWASRPVAERLAPDADGAAPEISSALFVMLVAELRRWGAGRREVAPLISHVDGTLELILRHGDRDHDGLVECGTSMAAIAEVQGYVYAAFRARAELARTLGDGDSASCWADAATGARFRFDDAFWDASSGSFATALDVRKQSMECPPAGIGHCLWTGIIKPANAAAAVAQIFGSGAPPRPARAHDDVVLAAGLLRYGFVTQAQRVVEARIARTGTGTAAPELLARTLLRLAPDVPAGAVHLAPVVPAHHLPLVVEGIQIGEAPVTIKVPASHTGQAAEVKGLPAGLRVTG